MLEMWANAPKNHAICRFYNLSHAFHAVQILPTLVFTATNTAHSVYFESLVGLIVNFKRPAAPQEPSWGLFGPQFLDTAHMRV